MKDNEYTDLVKELICSYLVKLEYHARALRQSQDIEHLHQLRTHLRRLRNGLKIFKDLFDPLKRRHWTKDLKVLSQVTSPARDEDVQIFFLESYKQALSHDLHIPAIKALIEELAQRRRQRQSQILQCLDQIEARKTPGSIQDYLAQDLKPCARPFSRIYKIAEKEISRRVYKLLDYEIFIDQPQKVTELHQMRIANKHLRYTLEGLAEIYSAEFKYFIQTVVFIHKTLGSMHDDDVWVELLSNKLKNTTVGDHAACDALEQLKNFCQSERNDCYNNFQKTWHQMRDRFFFEDLLGYITSAAEG